MEGDRIDWERLDRFILGEGSPEERAALEDWINADPSRRTLADAMRSLGDGAHSSMDSPRWDAPGALRHLRHQLGLSDCDASPVVPALSKTRKALRRVVLITGAAAAVVLGVFWRNLSANQSAAVPPQVWATEWTP